jgi:hypothetical protein
MFAVANADDLYPLDALRTVRSWDRAGQAVVGFRLAQTVLPRSGPVNRALCQTHLPPREKDVALELVALAEAEVSRTARSSGGLDEEWKARSLRVTKAEEFVVPGTQLVSMNLWALRSTIWPHFEEAVVRGRRTAESPAPPEVLLPVVMGDLIAREHEQVHVLPVEARCIGLTWPDELPTVQSLVAEMVAAGELPATAAVQAIGPS